MVSIIVGAVAMGIVSVCAAIPFGCIISRRMRKKASVVTPLEVVDEPETDDEELVVNSVEEVLIEPRYEIAEVWSGNGNGQRQPKIEIRVFVSSGSSRLAEVGSQGYATASRSSVSSFSQQQGPSGQHKERRRYSLQNSAAVPAAVRQSSEKSSVFPIAVRIRESPNDKESRNCDETKLEITISGTFSRSNTQFREFRNDVQDSSTPKRGRLPDRPEDSDNRDRSSFWRRVSFNRSAPPKNFKSTKDTGVVKVDVISAGDGSRQWRHGLSDSVREMVEDLSCGRSVQIPGPSQGNKSKDRGRWGLNGRFLETLRENTSFTNL